MRKINELKDIREIKCGECSSYCLDKNNSLHTFGNNQYGQLGVTYEIYKKAKKFKIYSSKHLKFKTISAGRQHFCGILINNTMCSFGNNKTGQCGFRNIYPKTKIFKPKRLKFDEKVRSVKCGLHYSILRDINGLFYSFGCNDKQQCLLFSNTFVVFNPTEISLRKIRKKIKCKMIIDLIPGAGNTFILAVNQ